MQISLPDELLLLALHDEKGSVIPAASTPLNGALVGAILMELALMGRLEQQADGSLLVDPSPTGDLLLDEVLQRIANADRPRTPSYWVGRLAGTMPRLKDRLLEGLVARGVLERRERRILWVFPSRSFPLADAAAEQQARERIRAVILEGAEPDQRTAALIGLVRACNLTNEIFAPHERAHASRSIAELTSEEAAQGVTFGGSLDAALMAALLGSTILYAYHAMNQPDDFDAGWSFVPALAADSSSDSTWDTNWSEPSSSNDNSSWDSSGDSGGGWSSDSGGGSSDFGGGGDSGGSSD